MAPELITPDETGPPQRAMPQMNAEDRVFVRRFNFLGLPSERSGGISFTGLKAELGDDNAAALVTKVGELVKSYGLDKLGASEAGAIDRVVQSLSPDERRTMAEGGTVPRAAELVQAEVQQAETQQKLTRTRPDELGRAGDRWNGFENRFAGGGNMAMRDGGSGERASSANYDAISTKGDWNSSAGQAYMREFALKSGVGWAASNPDLLRMGPSAIQVLADVKMREETFKRMTDAGLKKEAVVGFANLSKKNGDDPETTNRNGQKLADDLQDIGSRRYTGAVNRYLELNQPGKDVPQTTLDAAAKDVRNAGEEVKKADPSKGGKVDDSLKMLHIETEKNDKSHQIDNQKVETREEEKKATAVKAENKDNTKLAMLDKLGDDPTPSTNASSNSSARSNPPAAPARPGPPANNTPAKPPQAAQPKP